MTTWVATFYPMSSASNLAQVASHALWHLFNLADSLQCTIDGSVKRFVRLLGTRGAENGGLVDGLIRPDAEVFVWAQNDPLEKRNPKTGKTAAEKWLATVAENAAARVRSALTHAVHKDANEWGKAGAPLTKCSRPSTRLASSLKSRVR